MGLWHVVATFQALFTENTDVPALLEQGNPAAFSEGLCRLSEAPNVPTQAKMKLAAFCLFFAQSKWKKSPEAIISLTTVHPFYSVT